MDEIHFNNKSQLSKDGDSDDDGDDQVHKDQQVLANSERRAEEVEGCKPVPAIKSRIKE